MVERQGGDVSYVEHPEKLPLAPEYAVCAQQSGYITSMQTEEIGAVVGLLGAGRERKGEAVDPAAGARFVKKTGDWVEKGQKLALLYTNRTDRVAEAAERYTNAVTIGPLPPTERKLIWGRVTAQQGGEPILEEADR